MTIQLGFFAQDPTTALAQVGGKTAILNSFYGFGSQSPFPNPLVTQCKAIPATPMITWQPNTAPLADIIAGTYDGYITTWATAAKAAGIPIYVRFAHEMNHGWYPWGQPHVTPATYVEAWQHVVSLVRSIAPNVQFVWCISSQLTEAEGSLFPGDTYVDWVSMDGYNRDNAGQWRSFATIFDAGYHVITQLSSKPVLIAETASVEDPVNPNHKAGWIHNTFGNLIPNRYPKIQAACYFDAHGTENLNYAWDSSPAALSAIQAVFTSSLYAVAP